MEPITTIAALGAGNHVLTLLRGIADGVKGLGKAEILNQLIEAQLAMMELLQKHQKTLSENAELKQKLNIVEERLATTAKVEFHYEAYWLPRDDGSLDGPFSPMVWDLQRKLVRMHFHHHIQPNMSPKPTHMSLCALSTRNTV